MGRLNKRLDAFKKRGTFYKRNITRVLFFKHRKTPFFFFISNKLFVQSTITILVP